MCMESAGVHEFFVLLMQEPAAFGQILQFTYALGLASPTTKPSDGNCWCEWQNSQTQNNNHQQKACDRLPMQTCQPQTDGQLSEIS